MKGWRRKGGQVVAVFSRQETALVRGLVGQVHDMLTARSRAAPQDELAELTGIRTGPSTAPADPILSRLLPDFHRLDDGSPSRQDHDSAAALRSMYEPALVEFKTGTADVVLATCPATSGEVRLTDEQAGAWLSTLNDVRLALGTALAVTEDMSDDPDPDDPRAPHLGVYHWLTWVQESLVRTLSG